MGEVNATIVVKKRGPEKGYGSSEWTFDLGKGKEPAAEKVPIFCAESSQRYRSEGEAVKEAKDRIQLTIEKECGNISGGQN